MRPVLFEVSLRPGVRALSGVLSVLHSRAAEVAGMSYCIRSGQGSLLIRLDASSAQAELLARQIRRRVDVVDVRLREPLQVQR